MKGDGDTLKEITVLFFRSGMAGLMHTSQYLLRAQAVPNAILLLNIIFIFIYLAATGLSCGMWVLVP